MEGFYVQEHVSFLFDKDFQDGYKKFGINLYDYLVKPLMWDYVTPRLVSDAGNHLYGTV